MKVLVAIPDSNVGGITSSAVNFCNELTQRGHDVVLLDMSGKYQCADRLNANVERGSLSGRSRYWNLQAGDLKSAKGFRKIKLALLGTLKKLTIRSGLWYRLVFKKHRELGSFDVAIGFRQCAPCYSFVLHKVNAKKKMGFVHGELTYMGNISSWKKHMHKLDRVAYVSNAVKDQFVKAFPYLEKNACTVYNMFDKKQILKMAQEDNPFKFDDDTVNIVTVARIDNGFKRIDWIPEICKRLSEKTEKRFHWYIVGDGPDRVSVEKKIDELNVRSVVTLCGAMRNPYPLLKDASFSVLLSKSEAYPMTVMESLILKTPVIVTKFASASEMIENGKHGMISDFSQEDISDRILKMMTDQEQSMRINGFLSSYEFSNDFAYRQFLDSITV